MKIQTQGKDFFAIVEAYSKKSNLIFLNVPEADKETKDMLLLKICSLLESSDHNIMYLLMAHLIIGSMLDSQSNSFRIKFSNICKSLSSAIFCDKKVA